MSDVLTTLTHLINSPPGQLAAGGVLAGIVWKFFERVEAVLTDQTKLEIALWLRVRRTETGIIAEQAVSWPDTFRSLFDRVFGAKHWTWPCFWRSTVATVLLLLIGIIITFGKRSGPALFSSKKPFVWAMLMWLGFLIVAAFLSLLKTRRILDIVKGRNPLGYLLFDTAANLYIASPAYLFWTVALAPLTPLTLKEAVKEAMPLLVQPGDLTAQVLIAASSYGSAWLIFPPCFTSIWLWLYAGSGFLLKAARRFDIGFEWFNRHFDIEKKPLQSIGLVAGALVAVGYWTAVIVSRLV